MHACTYNTHIYKDKMKSLMSEFYLQLLQKKIRKPGMSEAGGDLLGPKEWYRG